MEIFPFHRVAVHQIMNIQNIDSINGQLYDILLRELDKIQTQSKSNGTKGELPARKRQSSRTADKVEAVTRDQVGVDYSQQDQSRQYVCSHCEQEAADDVIECVTCQEWFHFACEHLSEAEFKRLGDNEDHSYVCLSCNVGSEKSDNLNMQVRPDSNTVAQCDSNLTEDGRGLKPVLSIEQGDSTAQHAEMKTGSHKSCLP